jgi:hypothetical protein
VQPTPNLEPIAVTNLTAEDLSTIQHALAQISAGIAALQPYIGSVQAAPRKRPAPKTPMNGEILLSREQLARRWGCCIETIKRRERAGSLPSVRFNSRVVRYRLVDIERLEQQATTSRP